MRCLRPRSPAGHGAGSQAARPVGRTTVARFLFVESLGSARWHRSLLPIAFTVLATGIGLSCVLANVLDGGPTVLAMP